MASGVVTVGRRQYASGLYWENSPSGRISQAAKEAAHRPGQQADSYAVRSGNKGGRVPQFGLSQFVTGHKAGMPVLAGCIANQQPGSWAGGFRLESSTEVDRNWTLLTSVPIPGEGEYSVIIAISAAQFFRLVM